MRLLKARRAPRRHHVDDVHSVRDTNRPRPEPATHRANLSTSVPSTELPALRGSTLRLGARLARRRKARARPDLSRHGERALARIYAAYAPKLVTQRTGHNCCR
jgi:hypothetical protein